MMAGVMLHFESTCDAFSTPSSRSWRFLLDVVFCAWHEPMAKFFASMYIWSVIFACVQFTRMRVGDVARGFMRLGRDHGTILTPSLYICPAAFAHEQSTRSRVG